MGICLAVITAGMLHLRCAESVTAVITDKTVKWVFYHQAGPYLDDARNAVVEAFYRPEFADCDRLLIVDSDIEFTPADVRRLRDDDLLIVSGVYHNAYPGGVLPVVYGWEPVGDRLMLNPITAWPDGPIADRDFEQPLVRAHGIGAGFLMVHRDVFDALATLHGPPCPWFAEEIRDGIHYGEDLTFCLRARDAGLDVWVDRRVQVAHHKSMRLGGPLP